jgi:hypothetical protein
LYLPVNFNKYFPSQAFLLSAVSLNFGKYALEGGGGVSADVIEEKNIKRGRDKDGKCGKREERVKTKGKLE